MFEPFARGQLPRVGLIFIRPVNKQRFSDEVLARSESPKPAVVTVVAIITHEKEVIGRNANRSVVITLADLLRVDVDYVRLLNLVVIDIEITVTQFQIFTGKANDSLHKTNIWIFRRPERHDIASLDGASGQVFL